ncbi:arginine-tRNA-protein transferase [Spirosoma taeanense]|uniref:Arginine-tRNA-protein transferase n=1 Tax=Spirosoma taeanense TaxID=2735870 RepID=A0A6M5YGB1_9BACT|nr:GNAT family N-acetyltransferase [Spirosoma taeanense]QJW92380.1 arginine-tRNA-protein transferase [Spirosoma taeanense]
MKGSKLDLCLSLGYFRMHQDIFTCRYLVFDNTIFPVHWLRFVLNRVEYGPKQRRLLRSNEMFSVVVKPFIITPEVEALYSLYKSSVDFEAPESVRFWLLNGARYDAFESYAVEVRDGDRLIAVGVFDNGDQSIAGIMNFYHPAYRKHSLGKYLMLQKINYARLQQKQYYYPGYIVSNYPKFDYKLFPGEAATEVFDDTKSQWLPFSWETVNALAVDILDEY